MFTLNSKLRPAWPKSEVVAVLPERACRVCAAVEVVWPGLAPRLARRSAERFRPLRPYPGGDGVGQQLIAALEVKHLAREHGQSAQLQNLDGTPKRAARWWWSVAASDRQQNYCDRVRSMAAS